MGLLDTPVFDGTLELDGVAPIKVGMNGRIIPNFDFCNSGKQAIITSNLPNFPSQLQPASATDGLTVPTVRENMGYLPEFTGPIGPQGPVFFITQFDFLLNKLDLDTGVSDSDYTSTLDVVANSPFDTFAPQFNSLLAKLDLDTGISDTDYGSTLTLDVLATEQELFTNFNALLDKLDQDGGVVDSDYSTLGFQV